MLFALLLCVILQKNNRRLTFVSGLNAVFNGKKHNLYYVVKILFIYILLLKNYIIFSYNSQGLTSPNLKKCEFFMKSATK